MGDENKEREQLPDWDSMVPPEPMKIETESEEPSVKKDKLIKD